MVLLALMQANAAVLDVDANCAAVEAAAGKRPPRPAPSCC